MNLSLNVLMNIQRNDITDIDWLITAELIVTIVSWTQCVVLNYSQPCINAYLFLFNHQGCNIKKKLPGFLVQNSSVQYHT